MLHPETGLQLCLVDHDNAPSHAFDETRPGLDHLEFLVETRSDLDEWARRLATLGIPHSGVKDPPYTANAMITLRDPDNIQLEFFWYASDQARPDQGGRNEACPMTPPPPASAIAE